MVVPLNALNFDEDDCSSEWDDIVSKFVLFFVEADVQPDGSRVDQGLYVFKEGKAKKILDYGRDAAAVAGDDSKKAFFGAKDGLYVYNIKTNSAEKYGSVTDSIIAMDTERLGEVIYILTEDRDVYKVTSNGEKKEKLDDVVKAEQIVLDFDENLYFFADDKVPYVRTDNGVKKIEGLPDSTGTVTLFKPPFVIDEGAPVIINNKVFLMYPNGTSEDTNFAFQPEALPSAIAAEAALIQYYAYDRKIYEYNVLSLIESAIVKDLSDYLNKQAPEIRKFASKKSSPKRKLQSAN